MREFRNLDDAGEVLQRNVRCAVEEAIRALMDAYGDDYEPDSHGWVVLFDEETTDEDGKELFGVGWRELVTEGTVFDQRNGVFVTGWLPNNEFGLTLVVPDASWVDPVFRARLAADVVMVRK